MNCLYRNKFIIISFMHKMKTYECDTQHSHNLFMHNATPIICYDINSHLYRNSYIYTPNTG